MSAQRIQASFRDPSGFVFQRDGLIHRQVNRSYEHEYNLLHESGLYDELTAAGLLLPHEEVDVRLAMSESAYRVIRPVQLPFVSYPYEWCFGQLRDAALATLQVQQRALAHGMTLKDASAYNVQWYRGRPVFIDTLSFERCQDGEPWQAYRQFCEHFVAPFALMCLADPRLNQLLRVHLDGIPLDLACRLLPWRSRLRPSLALHLFLHARSQKSSAAKPVGRPVAATKPTRSFSRTAFEGLIANLQHVVSGLKLKQAQTTWSDYYTANNNYGRDGLEQKAHVVRSLLERARPETVWDLGANTGVFSRLAAECGAKTVVAWDLDHLCVEHNYRQMSEQGETALLPLLLDLTNPSPGIGWAGSERLSVADRGPADAILALGLVHHMAIANNVPLSQVAAYFRRLGKSLIVEWVPKEDSQVQRLLASRRDIYPDYHQRLFEQAFARQFAIVQATPVPGTLRTVYLMKGL